MELVINIKNTTTSRYFDEECVYWTEDAERNLVFLRMIENHANAMLKRRGFIFLNEIYDMLGISRSVNGQLVGWIYDGKCKTRANYVSFGLENDKNRDFISGFGNVALLEFNVDGIIINDFEVL